MAWLNPLIIKLRERWAGVPRPTQIVVVTTVAIAMMLAAYGLSWKGDQPHLPLFSGRTFSQQELMAIETAFGRAGLGDYRVAEGTVWMPEDQRAAYIGAIVEAGALPLDFDLDLKEALNKTSPFESSAQWQARLQLAKQRELAKILCSMSDIEHASVQFDEEVLGGLRNERRVRAMVVVRPHPQSELDACRIRSIRQLIAASKAYLEPENVTVTDLKTGISYAGTRALNPTLRVSDEYALRKATYEREWTDKIKQVLAFIPGVEVATNVELGNPGSTDLQIEEDYGSLQPSSVMVSVGIPHSYYGRVRQAHGPRVPRATPNSASIRRIEAETAAKVRQLVTGLLPSQLAPAAAQVSVATFTDLQAAPRDEVAKNWLASVWFSDPLALCCILGIIVIGILIAHGIWQDMQAHRLDVQLAAADENDGPSTIQVTPICHLDHPDAEAEDGVFTRDASVAPPGAIHKELTQLVRDDPDAAAEMLGEWMRKAS
jgi:flagellar biosynthesis/type III secretory pathway M-ring protein FliF/YscJ